MGRADWKKLWLASCSAVLGGEASSHEWATRWIPSGSA
jgi:hypothetical protein